MNHPQNGDLVDTGLFVLYVPWAISPALPLQAELGAYFPLHIIGNHVEKPNLGTQDQSFEIDLYVIANYLI